MKLHEIIEQRFSPMIFSDKAVSQEDVQTMLNAATWAASAYNAQPWRFIYGLKGSKTYDVLFNLMVEYNQNWAKTAPMLMLSIAEMKNSHSGDLNYWAMHDLGMAASSMVLQASSMGIQLHQMGGFDMDRARAELNIPESYVPVAMIAVGYPGNPETLDETFKKRANEKRMRKPIQEVAGDMSFFKLS